MKWKRRNTEASSSCHRVDFIHSGGDYFRNVIRLIDEATDSVHLQTYIFDDDDTGKLVADALTRASARGVKVYLMVDGYASRLLGKAFVRKLKDAGIHFRRFEPLFRSRYFYLGRRLHHKLLVVDTTRAIVGGYNISNRYNDINGQQSWLDFAVMLEGEAAKDLCILCWKTWKGFPVNMGMTPCEELHLEQKPADDDTRVSIMRNDWVRRKNQISSTYVNLLRNAEKEVVILCSYFLPGRILRNQIELAARKGIRIVVITAGLSDVKIAKHAERHMYKWLLQQGVEIYEYKPTVLHGKIAICDSSWFTIGSYNMNNLSAYASIELNLNIYNKGLTSAVSSYLNDLVAEDCVRITPEYYRKTSNLFKKLTRWLSYGLLRAAFNAGTFYYRHKT